MQASYVLGALHPPMVKFRATRDAQDTYLFFFFFDPGARRTV